MFPADADRAALGMVDLESAGLAHEVDSLRAPKLRGSKSEARLDKLRADRAERHPAVFLGLDLLDGLLDQRDRLRRAARA